MIEHLHEKIDVLAIFNRLGNVVAVRRLKWQNRIYEITKQVYVYKRREGRNINHVFHVSNAALHFKILFNTETLTWWLEEVSDGHTN